MCGVLWLYNFGRTFLDLELGKYRLVPWLLNLLTVLKKDISSGAVGEVFHLHDLDNYQVDQFTLEFERLAICPIALMFHLQMDAVEVPEASEFASWKELVCTELGTAIYKYFIKPSSPGVIHSAGASQVGMDLDGADDLDSNHDLDGDTQES